MVVVVSNAASAFCWLAGRLEISLGVPECASPGMLVIFATPLLLPGTAPLPLPLVDLVPCHTALMDAALFGGLYPRPSKALSTFGREVFRVYVRQEIFHGYEPGRENLQAVK